MTTESPVEDFSHAAFDELLDRFVDGHGGIDFASWQADASAVARLDEYLADVAQWSPDNSPRRFRSAGAALVYWARVYNAFLVKAVLAHADASELRSGGGPIAALHDRGLLEALEFTAGAERFDVRRLERDRLPGAADDARALLVRIGTAPTCPTLFPDLPKPGPGLEAFLARVAAAVVGDRANVRVDHAARKVFVAAVFERRRDEFLADLRRRGLPAARGIVDYLVFAAPQEMRPDLERAAAYDVVVRPHDSSVDAAGTAA